MKGFLERLRKWFADSAPSPPNCPALPPHGRGHWFKPSSAHHAKPLWRFSSVRRAATTSQLLSIHTSLPSSAKLNPWLRLKVSLTPKGDA